MRHQVAPDSVSARLRHDARSPISVDDLWRGELNLELIQLEHLRQHQHEVHKQLNALARADERVQLLETIPGVGRKTAEVVVAYQNSSSRQRLAQPRCADNSSPRAA